MNRILYIQYTNPGGYPPLQHSSGILANAGWNVLFLGTGAAGADALDFPPDSHITVRRMPFCPGGLLQKIHYGVFCAWVLLTTLLWRPEFIYASDPFSTPVALILTVIPGLRLIYHEHDSPTHSENRFIRLVLRARRLLARRADICILPNAIRLEQFETELAPVRRARCVWNCPTRAEVVRDKREIEAGIFRVVYHGTLGRVRLPESVIQAFALLPESVRLRITGYETVGSRGYTEVLRRVAEAAGVRDRIEFREAVPRAELIRGTSDAEIGLAMMPMTSPDPNYRGMVGASNKAFDYMACGLALIVSDLPEWKEMFVTPGYGLACDPRDPKSIAAAIRSLIEDPERMRAMGEAGRRKILSDWNYETGFRPVLDYMCTPVSA